AISDAIRDAFAASDPDETLFVYIAGHGRPDGERYYFVAFDTDPKSVADTGVPLDEIKAHFDASPCRRAFLWLDFCHSGGILPRGANPARRDADLISRSLRVVSGEGKLIVAACTRVQEAHESIAGGHGLFTHALLRGLRGEAADPRYGEVTATSLFDFIT